MAREGWGSDRRDREITRSRTNRIEPVFATVRLGTHHKSPARAPSGVKLLVTAEQSWRKLNGAELVLLVRAEIRFIDGVRAERGVHAGTTRPAVAKSKAKTKQVQDVESSLGQI